MVADALPPSLVISLCSELTGTLFSVLLIYLPNNNTNNDEHKLLLSTLGGEYMSIMSWGGCNGKRLGGGWFFSPANLVHIYIFFTTAIPLA